MWIILRKRGCSPSLVLADDRTVYQDERSPSDHRRNTQNKHERHQSTSTRHARARVRPHSSSTGEQWPNVLSRAQNTAACTWWSALRFVSPPGRESECLERCTRSEIASLRPLQTLKPLTVPTNACKTHSNDDDPGEHKTHHLATRPFQGPLPCLAAPSGVQWSSSATPPCRFSLPAQKKDAHKGTMRTSVRRNVEMDKQTTEKKKTRQNSTAYLLPL